MLDLAEVRSPLPTDPVLTPEWLATCAAAYVGAHHPADPRLSPLLGELGGLPPAVVVSGDRDLLQPDATRFTSAVTAAGGTVDHLAGSLWHEFPLQAGLLAEADRAVAHVARFLGTCWTQGRRGRSA
jgi:acetyl esterase/lipase